ncbi:MAG: DUF2784 domain-containing protein [Planctomycetota bacterium]|jgi:hypothetical protein
MGYGLLADLVLLLHWLFVAFVVLGLVLVLVGGLRRWRWVRNPWFRIGHLAAIAVVVVQAWTGLACPLTILERDLRTRAGETTYEGAFIAHWLHELLFYDADPWVFTTVYTAFGGLVLASWLLVRPRRPGRVPG